MPVGIMTRSMSSSELVEWIAMSRIEPFGGPVDDYRAGTIAAATYNVNRTEESSPIVDPLSLFSWSDKPEPPPPDTAEQVESKLREFAARQEALRKKLHR